MNTNKNIFRSLVVLSRYRNRVLEGVIHDVRQRYVGSVFGIAWAVLFPLLQLSIYATIYAVIFKIRPSGLTELGYVVLVFSGLVPLMAFNESLMAAVGSLSANKSLLLNTVFPAELIPLRAVVAAQIPGLSGLVITLVVGYSFGNTSWQAVVFVPIFWVLLMMFVMGIGWMLSLLTLVARDVQHGISLITMTLFFLSPFAYTPEMVPEAIKPLIYMNPLSYFVMTFQQLICYGALPGIVPATGAVILGLGSFLLGFSVFQRAKFVFFDYA